MSKPKVAFFDFTSCEGCQLTVVDSLQTHVDLLDAVEIVQFREAMTERGEDYIIAFIEGSCVRKSDEDRLKKIREQAVFVVALARARIWAASMRSVIASRWRRSPTTYTAKAPIGPSRSPIAERWCATIYCA